MAKKTKLQTVVSGLSAASLAHQQFNTWKTRYDEWQLYTATITSNSYVYEPMMLWLNQTTNTRKMKLISHRDGVKSFYDGTVTSSIRVEGHLIKVKVERPELGKRTLAPDDDMGSLFADSIIFRSRTKAGIEAVVRKLDELTAARKTEQRNIYVYNPGGYSGWSGSDFAYRAIDSVFLPYGVKEDLIEDFQTFLGNEKHYERIGVPWHRGYLFYGEPGNGKSSLAAALAHKFRMNLYNLPLSSVKDDRALAGLISDMSDHSILLLEDIDIFSKSMSRDQKDGAPTLAGLMNALDGVATPHGLLTIMTTNRPDTLDPALVRPGRIDKSLELKGPDDYQIQTMYAYAYGEELGVPPKEFKSMAELSEVFKRFTLDSESARMEIKGA